MSPLHSALVFLLTHVKNHNSDPSMSDRAKRFIQEIHEHAVTIESDAAKVESVAAKVAELTEAPASPNLAVSVKAVGSKDAIDRIPEMAKAISATLKLPPPGLTKLKSAVSTVTVPAPAAPSSPVVADKPVDPAK